METLWCVSSEGVQYFVRVDRKAGKLEYSRDPVSELVGGGYSEMIEASSLEKGYYRTHLLKLFGIDALEEMTAAARTLEALPEKMNGNAKELEHERNMKFYRELADIRSRRSPGAPGPSES